MALQYPALIRLVIDRSAPDERSSAIATLSIFFDLSQGLGLFVLGAVVAIFDGERAAFLAAAILTSSALAVLFRVTTATGPVAPAEHDVLESPPG
jgi:hypothetical protein